MTPFTYASLYYDYAYTGNSTIRQMAIKVIGLLGVQKEDIVWKSRAYKD